MDRQPMSSPHIATLSDLFCNFDPKRLTGKGNIKRTYKCSDKSKLVRQVFAKFMQIMLTDFVEGRKVFVLPCKRYAEFRFRQMPHEEFVICRQKSTVEDADILMTGGKTYQVVMNHRPYGVTKIAKLGLCAPLRTRIVEKMNEGFRYC